MFVNRNFFYKYILTHARRRRRKSHKIARICKVSHHKTKITKNAKQHNKKEKLSSSVKAKSWYVQRKNKTFLLTPRPKQKQKQNIHPQIQQAGDRPIFVRKQQKHNHTHAHTHTKSKQTPRSFDRTRWTKKGQICCWWRCNSMKTICDSSKFLFSWKSFCFVPSWVDIFIDEEEN